MSEMDKSPDTPIRDVSARTGQLDLDLDECRENARWRGAVDKADIERGREPFYYARPADPDMRLRIKRTLVQDLKECRFSREQVAEALSRLIGRTITLAQIDAWAAETKEHRLPAEYVPAWVRCTGSRRVLELLCAESGMWVADAEEHDFAEYGRARMQEDAAAARRSELERRLKGRV
jgi:hypothetical protein